MMSRSVFTSIVVLLTFFVFFEYTNIDLFLQDYFYNFDTQHWILSKDNYILKFFLYDGIKALFIIFVLSILISLIFFRKNTIILQYRRGLMIVLISSILIPLLIGALKEVTNIPCPKNLTHYNGTYPYVTVLSNYPKSFVQKSKIRCYPAGHASGGFALMSLFFLFLLMKNRIIALFVAMSIGWSVGTYKMLIGDHFLSHTVITMILSWIMILFIVIIIDKLFGFNQAQNHRQ